MVLERAIEQYEAVADLNHLRRCHYLLARLCHQDSSTSWQDLGIACLQKEPQDASIERAARWPETTNPSGAGAPRSNSCMPNPEQSFMGDSRSNTGQHADSV